MKNDPARPTSGVPSKEPAVKNADVPSQDAGLPGIGDEASAARYLRDTVVPETGGQDAAPDVPTPGRAQRRD